MNGTTVKHISHAIQVMIDLETTGLKPGCSIVQLAAVACKEFDVLDDWFFNVKISTSSNATYGLTPEHGTLAWWQLQDAKVREDVFSGNEDLYEALLQFNQYIKAMREKNPTRKIVFWAKPARFDFPILEAAYVACNLPLPYTHRDVMDARTVFKLYESTVPEVEFKSSQHNAFDDALNQAIHLNSILQVFSHGH